MNTETYLRNANLRKDQPSTAVEPLSLAKNSTPVNGTLPGSDTRAPFGIRLKSLDGLRGVAILAVIAFHALRVRHATGLFGGSWSAIQWSLWAGVDLFFALSGFLITGILLDSREDKRYFLNFYARRTVRIFPLYYAVLTAALLIVPAVIGLSHLPPLYPRLLENQLWLWTYLQNYLQSTGEHTLPGFGHFWTLAVEEQFYWVWPLIVYFTNRHWLLRVCVLLCAASPLLRLALSLSGDANWAIRQYTFTRADSLLYGAMVALVLRNPDLTRWVRRVAPMAALASVMVLAGILVKFGMLAYEATETIVLGYSALGILSAMLIYHLVTRQGQLAAALSRPSIRWFGKYSYGMYVFHWPITQAYEAALRPKLQFGSPYLAALASFFVITSISGGVAFVSWHVFEVHFLKLKKYFEYSPEPAKATGDSPTATHVPDAVRISSTI